MAHLGRRQPFKPLVQRFNVYTVAGQTGTGALTTPAVTAAGIGVVGRVGTGALTTPAVAASGVGTLGRVGTGAATTPATTLAGQGTLGRVGTGAATTPATSVTGAGTLGRVGTGAATTPATTTAGAGTLGRVGTGAASIPAVAVAGEGNLSAGTGFCGLTTEAGEQLLTEAGDRIVFEPVEVCAVTTLDPAFFITVARPKKPIPAEPEILEPVPSTSPVPRNIEVLASRLAEALHAKLEVSPPRPTLPHRAPLVALRPAVPILRIVADDEEILLLAAAALTRFYS